MENLFDDELFDMESNSQSDTADELMNIIYKEANAFFKRYRIDKAYIEPLSKYEYNYFEDELKKLEDFRECLTRMDKVYCYELDTNQLSPYFDKINYYSDILNSNSNEPSYTYEIHHNFICVNLKQEILATCYMHIVDYRSDNSKRYCSCVCEHTFEEIQDIICFWLSRIKQYKDKSIDEIKKSVFTDKNKRLKDFSFNEMMDLFLNYIKALIFIRRYNPKDKKTGLPLTQVYNKEISSLLPFLKEIEPFPKMNIFNNCKEVYDLKTDTSIVYDLT